MDNVACTRVCVPWREHHVFSLTVKTVSNKYKTQAHIFHADFTCCFTNAHKNHEKRKRYSGQSLLLIDRQCFNVWSLVLMKLTLYICSKSERDEEPILVSIHFRPFLSSNMIIWRFLFARASIKSECFFFFLIGNQNSIHSNAESLKFMLSGQRCRSLTLISKRRRSRVASVVSTNQFQIWVELVQCEFCSSTSHHITHALRVELIDLEMYNDSLTTNR